VLSFLVPGISHYDGPLDPFNIIVAYMGRAFEGEFIQVGGFWSVLERLYAADIRVTWLKKRNKDSINEDSPPQKASDLRECLNGVSQTEKKKQKPELSHKIAFRKK